MEEIKLGKRLLVWFISILFAVSGIAWFFSRSEQIVTTGIIRYEEFQEIYNTCQKLNTDLQIIQSTPETDKQFEQFTKSQRVNSIKQNLNRWVEDYNAKSKVWTRSMWKSNSLPYQLSVNDFSNFNK
jgi:uncharacterized membrane protein YfbV (UPF0208 family)